MENPQASPGRRAAGAGAGGAARRSLVPMAMSTLRHSRDPRPVGDRAYAAQCARNVVDLLSSSGYGKPISYEKLLKDPSTKEFFDIFRFFIAKLDVSLQVNGKLEDEVPTIMRRLKYPVEVNRSKLQAISGPNTWPQLLAVLDWLVVLVRINDELIEPVAACEVGLADIAHPEQEGGDHQLLRSLHENYVQYLGGKDDQSDEERLRQIYEQRIAALQGEIDRLQAQHTSMEQQLEDFNSEHDRLIELQKAPAQLEVEADRLRGEIQSQEARVRRLEEELASADSAERRHLLELEGLQVSIRELSEKVESQAYSKTDIERLKCERGHLRQVLHDLRTDTEKAEQGVWELGMQESSHAENIGRLVRHINESVESLDPASAGEVAQDLLVRVDLNEPTDALAIQDFADVRKVAQGVLAAHFEAKQGEEASFHSVLEEQRAAQEELSERERECRRHRVRLEQLSRMREEYRVWSASQLDDAQRTAESTEDAVHEVSIGGKASSLQLAAEVDRLRMVREQEKQLAADEKTELEEMISRAMERFEEKKRVFHDEINSFVKSQEMICKDVETALRDDGDYSALHLSPRAAGLPRHGGC